eukprot:2439025-Lingulodinium_polyedra.AAC.1
MAAATWRRLRKPQTLPLGGLALVALVVLPRRHVAAAILRAPPLPRGSARRLAPAPGALGPNRAPPL